MTIPDITQSDLSAEVEMGKLSDGYFSDPMIAQEFIDVGIQDIVSEFGDSVNYTGFGGGEGYLTKKVEKFIVASGRRVSTLVIDANSVFLTKAAKIGLAGLCADVSQVSLIGYDLVTMRSVNHYNPIPVQQKLIRCAFEALTDGGWLVSQNLSGPSEAYCRLASQLSKFPSLGRVKTDLDEPHMTSEAEFTALMQNKLISQIFALPGMLR